MKVRKILICLLFGYIIASCDTDTVDSPFFEVSVPSNTVKVGDPVVFSFEGNPNSITFYSGEVGKKFENRKRVYSPDNKLQVRFTSLVQSGVDDNLSLLVSNNFSGIASTTSVQNASWTDISNRAVFSTGADNTPSGTIDLSDFSNSGLPVCLAFRYTTDVIKAQNRWVIRSINVESNDLTDGVTTIGSMSNSGWMAVNFQNPLAVWSITTAQLLMNGGSTALDDDWVITKNFEVKKVNPDLGLSIKNIATALSSYTYKFTKAGTYQVAFVASNNYANNSKEVVRLLTLVVEN